MPLVRTWILDSNGFPQLPEGETAGPDMEQAIRTVVEFLAQVKGREASRPTIAQAIRADEKLVWDTLHQMRTRSLVHTANGTWQLRKHVGRPGGPYEDLVDVHPPRAVRPKPLRITVPAGLVALAEIHRDQRLDSLGQSHRASWRDNKRRSYLERSMGEVHAEPTGESIFLIAKEWAEREISTMELAIRRRLPTINQEEERGAEEVWQMCHLVNRLRKAIGLTERKWPEGTINGQLPYVARVGLLAFNQLPPGKVHWRKLHIWNGFRLREVTDEERVTILRAFREGAKIPPRFSFWESGLLHEDPKDMSTWGPRTPDQIDWAGFPDAVVEPEAASS